MNPVSPSPEATAARLVRAPRFSARSVAGIIALVLLGLLIWRAADVLLLGFAAVLAAVCLHGAQMWLVQTTRLSPGFALAAVILALLTFVAGLVITIAAPLAAEIDQLARALPDVVRHWSEELQRYEWGRWIFNQANGAGGNPGSWLGRLGGFFSTTFGFIANAIFILIIGIYLAAEADRYQHGFLRLLPYPRRERTYQVMTRTASILRRWMLGQMAAMLFIGIATYIGLTIMGVPLALAFATLSGVFNFVPNFGPLISMLPPVLLMLAKDPIVALYVVLFYAALQAFEGWFLTPMVQRQAVSLPPALLLFNQIILAAMLGFFGLLLAAPLTAAMKVLVEMLYVEDALEPPGSAELQSDRLVLPGSPEWESAPAAYAPSPAATPDPRQPVEHA
jgi:predicted PurR-regulated permease PerM